MATPIKLTFYDSETQEVKAEYCQMFVPWRMLKGAMKLNKQLHGKELAQLDADDMDALSGLVVETFGGRFSLQDLENYAEIGEVMAVFKAIVSRAGQTINPT